jgi:hypothetical protein
VDARADLFSLGVVLYAACSGASPFRDESPFLTLERIRCQEAAPLDRIDPSLPPWFCAAVHRLLRKVPADRIASAAELADLLQRHGSAPTLAVPRATAPTAAARPWARRFRRWWVAAIAALLIAVLGLALYPGRPKHNPVEPDRSPQSGFFIAGQKQGHRRLPEAVAAANDGDTIEIYGDGPFPTPPVRTAGKRLTIRAAPGSRPVFLTEAPGRQPFLCADADLQLEGLDVRWTIEVRPSVPEADLLSHCVIVSSHGKLMLNHCRVETGRLNASLGASGRELAVKNCHLLNGVGAFVRLAPGGQVRVEGCQLEVRCGLSILTAAEPRTPAAVTVLLAENTFVTTTTLQLLGPPGQPLNVTARRNVFDNNQLVVLQRRTPRPAGPPEPEEIADFLRSLVQWSDEANLYRRGSEYLVYTVFHRPSVVLSAEVQGSAGWLKLCKQPPNDSVEGVLRYCERADSSPIEPLRLDRVDAPSGPVPAGVGANADLVGPPKPGPDAR